MAVRSRSPEDPLAADRRTLVIAATAMLGLVAVGVASAALFTGSACDDIQPTAAEVTSTAAADIPAIVDHAFADLASERRERVVDALSHLAGRLGPVTGAAAVGGAEQLEMAASGAVAVGPTTYVLADGGASVRAAAILADPAVVVGGGATLYTLALMNDVTGQVDAVQPLDLDLEPAGTCFDAAMVNVPFAFHLDARDSQLLVLRVEDDGAEPELELRSRLEATWQAPLELPSAPPGVLGERLSAQLGEELVVVARRVIPGESEPAVAAVARADGVSRWTVSPSDLPLGDEPTWLEVVEVTADTVLLALGGDGRETTRLVGLDADDGSVRWSDGSGQQRADVVVGDGRAHELVVAEGQLELRELDVRSGERMTVRSVGVGRGRLAGTSGRFLVALDRGGVAVMGEDGQVGRLDLGVEVLDLAADDDVMVVLLGDGDDALAVTFGAP